MIQTRYSNLIDFPQRVLLNMDQPASQLYVTFHVVKHLC